MKARRYMRINRKKIPALQQQTPVPMAHTVSLFNRVKNYPSILDISREIHAEEVIIPFLNSLDKCSKPPKRNRLSLLAKPKQVSRREVSRCEDISSRKQFEEKCPIRIHRSVSLREAREVAVINGTNLGALSTMWILEKLQRQQQKMLGQTRMQSEMEEEYCEEQNKKKERKTAQQILNQIFTTDRIEETYCENNRSLLEKNKELPIKIKKGDFKIQWKL